MLYIQYKDTKCFSRSLLKFPLYVCCASSQNVPAIVEFAWHMKVSREAQAYEVEPQPMCSFEHMMSQASAGHRN